MSKPKKAKRPISKVEQVSISLLITLIIGALFFYFFLPAINLKSGDFYTFAILLCIVFAFVSLLVSGTNLRNEDPRSLIKLLKSRCLPAVILVIALVAVALVGYLVSAPVFRARSYRDLLQVDTGDFASEVAEVSYEEIPMLDESSAQRLGDRRLGELADLVSQFEVAETYTQINFLNRPVRVTYLNYGDFFKWINNREEGLPAYITVDMVTQEVSVVRLSSLGLEGIKYSPTELFGRNLQRHIRFRYPTFMFSQPTFEIDETGHPWWVCPRLAKTIGLFGGVDIEGAVLVDAITGECTYFPVEEIPNWVDRVYPADLIMQQYDYHGTYINGFLNSFFGQQGVTVTTSGYNYIAMDDDVYMYTGVTSVSSDESNVGFLLSNQRTKQTTYYAIGGAIEESARDSAEGVVQDLGYKSTFPLLLNIGGEPTYFMSLKDQSQLVKQYAMVNVSQYQIVATGVTVAECEANYLALLSAQGITVEPVQPVSTVQGAITDIRAAVMNGNSRYFIKLSGSDTYYSFLAVDHPLVVLLNVGDSITVTYTTPKEDHSDFLEGRSVTRN